MPACGGRKNEQKIGSFFFVRFLEGYEHRTKILSLLGFLFVFRFWFVFLIRFLESGEGRTKNLEFPLFVFLVRFLLLTNTEPKSSLKKNVLTPTPRLEKAAQ